jgi:hypothetical protein
MYFGKFFPAPNDGGGSFPMAEEGARRQVSRKIFKIRRYQKDRLNYAGQEEKYMLCYLTL